MAMIIPWPCNEGDDFETITWCVQEISTGDLFTVQRIIRMPDGAVISTILIRNRDGLEINTTDPGFDWLDYTECADVIIQDYETITWCVKEALTGDLFTVQRIIQMPSGTIISTILIKNSDNTEIDTSDPGFDWGDYIECDETIIDDYETITWCSKEVITGDLFTVRRIIKMPGGEIISTVLVKNSDGSEIDADALGFDWLDYEECAETIIEDYEVVTWCVQETSTDDLFTVRRTIHMPDGAIINTVLTRNRDGFEIDADVMGFDWLDYRECEEIPVYPQPGAACYDGVVPFQPPALNPNNMTVKNCGLVNLEVSLDGGLNYLNVILPGGELGFGGSDIKVDLSLVWFRSEAAAAGVIEIIWEA